MIFPSVVVAGGRPEVAFQETRTDTADHAPGVPYSFSGVSFGAAHARRHVLVFAGLGGTGNLFSPSAVTIGGVTATQVYSQFWSAPLPTGTSGDVVISGGNAFNGTIAVWSLYKFKSMTAVDTDGSPALPPYSINANSQGYVFGFARGIIGTTDVVWSGLTEDAEFTLEGGFRTAFASVRATAAGPLSVSATLSGSGGTPQVSLISLR